MHSMPPLAGTVQEPRIGMDKQGSLWRGCVAWVRPVVEKDDSMPFGLLQDLFPQKDSGAKVVKVL